MPPLPFNSLVLICLALTAIFRIAEVTLGEINARKMLKDGGKEFSPEQRLPILLIYAAWLAGLLLLTPSPQKPLLPFLIAFALLQVLRWWAIGHLKKFWTTRIVVMPLAWKISTGPYRFLKHPIYIALAGEVVCLSLAFGQWAAACFFGGLVAMWLFFRIRAESRALSMML